MDACGWQLVTAGRTYTACSVRLVACSGQLGVEQLVNPSILTTQLGTITPNVIVGAGGTALSRALGGS